MWCVVWLSKIRTYCCGFNWWEFVSISGQYCRMEERQLRGLTPPPPPAEAAAATPTAMDSMMMCGITDAQKLKPTMMPPCPQHTSCASHSPILSVLGNYTRSYPRLTLYPLDLWIGIWAIVLRPRCHGWYIQSQREMTARTPWNTVGG